MPANLSPRPFSAAERGERAERIGSGIDQT
jgi:hypothetical protein